MEFRTEFQFELPKGYVDSTGNVHKKGTIRLATAADEILPMRDPRVQQNPGYLTVILLTRVVTKLGSLKMIDTDTIESLFTADFNYLQNFYQEVNEIEKVKANCTCPNCKNDIEVEVSLVGKQEMN